MAIDDRKYLNDGLEDDGNSLLDRVEAGLISQIKRGSSKKKADQKHEHAHGKDDEEVGTVERKKRKHRDSAKMTSSAGIGLDADEGIVDLDTIRTLEKMKRRLERLNSQEFLGTQFTEAEQGVAVDGSDENQERARRKEEKRLRKEAKRAARKFLGDSNRKNIEGGEQVIGEGIVFETPTKKRKLDKKVFQGDLEPSRLAEEPRAVDVDTRETPKSTPKKKRKLDQSSQTSPLQLNSTPVHDAKSSIVNASPQTKTHRVGQNDGGNPTPKHKNKRKLDKLSQEPQLSLHTVPLHQSPSGSKHTIFDNDDNQNDEVPEKKKKHHKKEKSFLVPSSLLTPAAKANRALLQTVIKSCGPHISGSNAAPEEASKATSNSTSSTDSSADENNRRPLVESPIKPPKPKIDTSSPRSPIRPENVVASEAKQETAILPPKKLVQTATRTPIVVSKLVRTKKAKAKPTPANADEDEILAQKLKALNSKTSKNVKASAGDEETLSQAIASIKKATSSKIHGLFSDNESEGEEDPFSQVVDSIRKSSSMLQSIFPPQQRAQYASETDRKGEKTGPSVEVARARIVSAQALLPGEDGLKTVSDEWESTVGKVRSSAHSDDDTEAQESECPFLSVSSLSPVLF